MQSRKTGPHRLDKSERGWLGGVRDYFLISGVGSWIANGEVHAGLWLGASGSVGIATHASSSEDFFGILPFFAGGRGGGYLRITAIVAGKSHLLDNLLIATSRLHMMGRWSWMSRFALSTNDLMQSKCFPDDLRAREDANGRHASPKPPLALLPLCHL